MIRAATLSDVASLGSLGRVMHAESPRFSKLAYDQSKAEATLTLAVQDHFCVVYEEGGIILGGMAALATPLWCSTDIATCDIALFINPEKRGSMAAARMLKAYGQWAKNKGAKMILFGVLTGVEVAKTVKLAKACGWRLAGHVLEL